MKPKVFIDGQYGTTGLNLYERLAGRDDIVLTQIAKEAKKDQNRRKELLNEADLVFLCLPDQAAKEAVALIENDRTRVIDGSTAHRVHDDWVYGIPELTRVQREKIRQAKRVSVSGCHATGFVLTIKPLVEQGIISREYPLVFHSVTGYSGGGKKLISLYQSDQNEVLKVPRNYALGLNHKHLPEMKKHSGLAREPLFTPIVSNFYKGMVVAVPLFTDLLNKYKSPSAIHSFLREYYSEEQFVKVMPFNSEEYLYEEGFNLIATNETNRLEIFVFGNEAQILLMARLDNLGKGASGAAVQNMNIMLGADEAKGLL